VQVLGEVPLELRVTPERDQRLAEQAQALSETDAVRLLDLVSGSLEATANGAQARIQLELVLIKAAAPELDPSTAALLSRIERLEAGLAQGPGLRTVEPHKPQSNGERAAIPAQPAPAAVHSAPAAAHSAPAAAAQTAPAAAAQTAPAAAAHSAPAAAAQTAPAAATDTAPAAPSSTLDLPSVVGSWPAVIEVVRGGNAMLAALLADARPVAISQRELTLAFPPGAAFLKRKAEQDDHRRVAADAFRNITGQSLALRYELRELDEPADDPPGETTLSGEELVRRFLEEFDAEELLEEESDEREAT